jgi:hypothetical protein
MLKNRQQRLEGFKPSKRYTILIQATLDLFHHHLQ